jgi:hypothetical protein
LANNLVLYVKVKVKFGLSKIKEEFQMNAKYAKVQNI